MASEIDEDQYSRQLYVLGHAAQQRMQHSDILIVGCRGVGVEIAKNIILMGVKSVALFDPEPATYEDLAAQFYLSLSTIGHPRAAACVAQLAALNQYVSVTVLPEATLTDDVLRRFHVTVCTDQPLSVQTQLGAAIRRVNRKFIVAEARGIGARIFCDFGSEFVVDDTTGENPVLAMIEKVTQAEAGVVTTAERHGLSSGDHVTFVEIKGMTQLNDSPPRPITVTSPYTFTIEDTRGYGAYTTGGMVKQVKLPVTMTFKPFDALLGPVGAPSGPTFEEVIITDLAKFDSLPILHTAFNVWHEYVARNGGRAPLPSDTKEVTEIVQAVQERIGTTLDGAALATVVQFARTAGGHVSPMCALLGGTAGQEVIKAVSGKFSPVKQWLYVDMSDALPYVPDLATPLSAAEFTPVGDRYDGQARVFGHSTQAGLKSLRYFLVGAGAIGCEVLKNWAMMGIGTNPDGYVHITDMDRIEKSNLSRQFLFRASDVSKPKSVTAKAAAQVMNPAMNIMAHETRAGPDTENVFNDEFWNGLSGACNALDNIDARLYVDSRCVYFRKPLMESGTLGPKGNTQIVVPYLTENYGSSQDPPSASIPVCTLKNFPFKIEHTLQWARDWFEGEFKLIPDAVNAYLTQPGFLGVLAQQPNSRLETLLNIYTALVAQQPKTVEDCITWAREQFDTLFYSRIRQLLHDFPPGTTDKDGNLFWSGTKRQPKQLEYNHEDPVHASFVYMATFMRAQVYGLKFQAEHTREHIARYATTIRTAAASFVPSGGVKTATTDEEFEQQRRSEAAAAAASAAGAGGASATSAGSGWDVDSQARDLESKLPPPASLAGYRLNPLDFEKDDDTHIAMITACSNMRARNYGIEEADAHTSKGIAGNIIPAIATTTAVVSGFICMEMYKLLARKPLEAFRNLYTNLALPTMVLSEPVPPKRHIVKLPPSATFAPPAGAPALEVQADGWKIWQWSIWDRMDFKGPLTLDEFMAHIKELFGLEELEGQIGMLVYGSATLYSFSLEARRKRERGKYTLGKLAQAISKSTFPAGTSHMTMEMSIQTSQPEPDDVLSIPYIRYQLDASEI